MASQVAPRAYVDTLPEGSIRIKHHVASRLNLQSSAVINNYIGLDPNTGDQVYSLTVRKIGNAVKTSRMAFKRIELDCATLAPDQGVPARSVDPV